MQRTETQQPSRLYALLKLMHLFNGITSGIGAMIGYAITVWNHGLTFDYGVMLAAGLVTLFVSNGGFIVNDILDIEIDRINRPDRPLAAGLVSLRVAWIVCIGFTLVGIILGFMLGLWPGIVALLIAAALFLYSFGLKHRFLIGHLTIATMGSALLPFGALAAGELAPVIYSVAFVFPAFVAREVLKTVPDYEGDRAAGVENIATRYGPQAALRVAQVALALVALILPLVMLVWPLNALYLIVVLAIIWPLTFYTLARATVENVKQVAFLAKMLFLLTTLALLVGSIPGI
ncbi:MAG: geranylgeranylglycerol-phosphate geranylgeranyltransferase [Anaerolineae bacterium]|nr:geranylgeranylglycerol-phosphate geranylgeranyltransferase [Anaerolineae bacterium]